MLLNIALLASLVFGNSQITLDRPEHGAWALTESPGHAIFTTPTDGLTDNNVASSTQIFWEDNTANPADNVRLSTNIPDQYIRVAGLMNLTLPVNTNITCRTYNGTTAIASYNNRTTQMPDGSTAIWFVFNNPTAISNRIDFIIYNDIGTVGIGHLPRPVTFDIGEVWFSDSYPYPVP